MSAAVNVCRYHLIHAFQDGARPHTAQLNKRVFAAHGKMKQFEIEVVAQPAQNPDLNVDKLALFLQLAD